MQCVFFQRRYTQCTMESGAKPQDWGIFENFCVKSNLTVCKVTFKCKLQKEIGAAGCTSCSLNNLLAEQLLPCSPSSCAYEILFAVQKDEF